MEIDEHTMYLYCDNKDCWEIYPGLWGQKFIGKNTTECRKQAKAAGWNYYKNNRNTCKHHKE